MWENPFTWETAYTLLKYAGYSPVITSRLIYSLTLKRFILLREIAPSSIQEADHKNEENILAASDVECFTWPPLTLFEHHNLHA